jgi:hypothetical protein
MGRKSRSYNLLDKAVQAASSAIELYNKPNFLYREESFTILMVNAWELLLKAKLLNDNNNKLSCIYSLKQADGKNGKSYKKPRYEELLSKNKKTITVEKAMERLSLPKDLKDQLGTIIEIRNNAIHFYNESKIFDNKLLEVGTATLKSFTEMLGEWFNYPIGKYKLFLIPLAFDIPENFDASALAKESVSHQKLLRYIAKKEENSDKTSKHRISLRVNVRFDRDTTGIPVHLTGNGGAPITIDSEEKFRKKYSWSYKDNLIPKLRETYSDFSQNALFYRIKKELEKDINYSAERQLNWNKKNGSKQRFYSPNIMKEFDKHYTKRTS